MKKIALWVLPILIGFLLYHYFSAPKIKNARPLGENIICFGDSLTFGTGATKGMDYPSQLSNMITLRRDWWAESIGMSGPNQSESMARFLRNEWPSSSGICSRESFQVFKGPEGQFFRRTT